MVSDRILIRLNVIEHVLTRSVSTEEVIKRRLLIDGDGTGDDRRLNLLVKSFIKWVNTNDSAENM